MKFNTTASAASFIALIALATPSLAETTTSDCDGWTMTGTHQFNPDGLSRFFDTKASLQRLIGNEWVEVQESHDCGLVGPEPGMITMGRSWDAAVLEGNYRVLFTQRVFLNWWTDLETAKAESEFMQPSYIAEREGDGYYCPGTGEQPDARTPGFWKNHPEAWGQNYLLLGDAQTAFGEDCLLELLSVPTRGDARVKLAHHLIAAKLNMLAGSDATVVTNVPFQGDTILDTIDFADSFLLSVEIHCDGFSGNKPSGLAKDVATATKDALDAYNNNLL